ncbi:MAG: 4a-hydroxytetrahydrobiopterin dehydratase [Gammaproteobacteria bacterium]|nr:4a-hydroxytetrahydrobiopterin dehydratase [Gammaproteobacteria bacterium]
MLSLHQQHCNNKTRPQLISKALLSTYLTELSHWTCSEDNKIISRRCQFTNYYQTLAFINAVAWIAHQENHHPDIQFSYNQCTINYTTHSANGITLFDFICAAHIEQLLLNPITEK